MELESLLPIVNITQKTINRIHGWGSLPASFRWSRPARALSWTAAPPCPRTCSGTGIPLARAPFQSQLIQTSSSATSSGYVSCVRGGHQHLRERHRNESISGASSILISILSVHSHAHAPLLCCGRITSICRTCDLSKPVSLLSTCTAHVELGIPWKLLLMIVSSSKELKTKLTA